MRSLHLVTTYLVAICLAGCAARMSGGAAANDMNTITGTVSYREKTALPAGAVLSVRLENVSQQDAAAILVSEITFAPQHSVPIPFALKYDPQSIDDRLSYAVRATIRSGDQELFVTDAAIPVLTGGNGNEADIVVRSSAPPEATPSADADGT